jgi:hypothetical protein
VIRTSPIIDEATEMYPTENGVSADRRVELNRLMNQRLATAIDLQMQMKQAYWNVMWIRSLNVLCNSAVSLKGR